LAAEGRIWRLKKGVFLSAKIAADPNWLTTLACNAGKNETEFEV